MIQPLPSVSQAYTLVAQEENHKDLSQLSLTTDNMDFIAEKRNYGMQNSQRTFGSNNAQFYQRPAVSGTTTSDHHFLRMLGQKGHPNQESTIFALILKCKVTSLIDAFKFMVFHLGSKGLRIEKAPLLLLFCAL